MAGRPCPGPAGSESRRQRKSDRVSALEKRAPALAGVAAGGGIYPAPAGLGAGAWVASCCLGEARASGQSVLAIPCVLASPVRPPANPIPALGHAEATRCAPLENAASTAT